jgi:hypothetical protein
VKLKRYKWSDIDPKLFQATTAPTKAEKRRLLKRVLKKSGMTTVTLRSRLKHLGIFHLPPPASTPALIDSYKARMESVLLANGLWNKLQMRLSMQTRKMLAYANRSVSIAQAASMLQVHRTHVETWCKVLGLMKLDKQGKIPFPELRLFLQTPTGHNLMRVAKGLTSKRIEAIRRARLRRLEAAA